MIDLKGLVADLAAEHRDLDDILARSGDAAWDVPTPAPGWAVRDQVSHLAFFDEQALLAAVEPGGFTASLDLVSDVDAFMNDPLEKGRLMSPDDLLAWWRNARTAMLDAFASVDPSERIPWFGPPMSPASFVSARLMETWAHGQDIVDALGLERTPTDRLYHVAHLGVRARRNSYAANGREMPEEDVRVELKSPGGETWLWNGSASPGVSGDVVDFCLVVTQRRHLDDTNLVVEGDLAREWMTIAQAFAGPPGEGRVPGQFRRTDS